MCVIPSDDQRLGGLQVLVAFGWISGNEPEVEAIWAQNFYFLISFEFTDSYSLLQNVVLESQKRWWDKRQLTLRDGKEPPKIDHTCILY